MRITTPSFAALSVLALFSGVAPAAVKTEVVDYKHGDVQLQGYLACDDVHMH